MIQEAYCSFEISKLLKEKGFDELCSKKYNSDKNIVPAGKMIELWQNSEFDIDEECSAPTLQMACAWLRINHQIFIRPNIIFAVCPIEYYCEILCYGDNLQTQQDVDTEDFETPEKAIEAALKYCLENLI